MFFQSKTFKVLKRISEKAQDGATYNLFLKLSEKIKEVYKKSITKRYIDSGNVLNKPWSASGISRIADCLFSLFSKVLWFFGDLIKKLSNGSVCGFICDKTFKKLGFSNTVAVVFSLIFLCYSTWWNNMYALFAALLLFVILIYKKKDDPIKPSQIDFFLVLFGISIILGVIASPNKGDAIRIALIAATSLLFMMITVVSLDDSKKVKNFLRIMSVAIGITAVVAIFQRLSGIEVDKEFVDVTVNAGMPGRVYSTMENPNNYAELLVLFMPFMIALFVDEEKVWFKVLWGMVFALTFVALAMTYSRSCYVAIAIAIVVFILVYDYRLILPLAGIVIIAIPLLPETVMNRILTIGSLEDSSNSYRLYIWDTCMNLIVNYGVSGLGIGPEAFSALYKPVAHTAAIKAPHSHMLYMELVLEYGIVGFVGFFGYLIRVIRNGFGVLKLATKNQKAYIGAGIGALLGICFVSMAEYIWFYPRDMFAHFIVIGLLVAIINNIKNESGVAK